MRFFILALCAFLGGFAANLVTPALAENGALSYWFLGDNANRKGVESYVNNGYPAQNFYGRDGQLRLQMGTYNAGGEAGLPMVGLSDNHGHLKMLFRLAGPNESPVIIMKDNAGRDRVVMGLGLNDAAQDPFLATFGANGQKTMVYGSY